jgi:hypothetical protein
MHSPCSQTQRFSAGSLPDTWFTHNRTFSSAIKHESSELAKFFGSDASFSHPAGWTRKPLLARYKAHCDALAQQPNAAVLSRLASKDEAEEEVELPNCGLTDDSGGPLLAALEECESLTSLNLSQNALGEVAVQSVALMCGDLGTGCSPW